MFCASLELRIRIQNGMAIECVSETLVNICYYQQTAELVQYTAFLE